MTPGAEPPRPALPAGYVTFRCPKGAAAPPLQAVVDLVWHREAAGGVRGEGRAVAAPATERTAALALPGAKRAHRDAPAPRAATQADSGE